MYCLETHSTTGPRVCVVCGVWCVVCGVWCVVCSPIIYQETDERGEGLTRHGVVILN